MSKVDYIINSMIYAENKSSFYQENVTPVYSTQNTLDFWDTYCDHCDFCDCDGAPDW